MIVIASHSNLYLYMFQIFFYSFNDRMFLDTHFRSSFYQIYILILRYFLYQLNFQCIDLNHQEPNIYQDLHNFLIQILNVES